MIEDIVGNNGTRFIIAAGAVALALLCLVGVLRFMRNRPSSPFIRGGKNRQPRLAVLDAAAIDTRRRLVLVRRDDVEHLIMIGGPTDVVIESRIASTAQPQAPAAIAQPPADAAIGARPVTECSVAERTITERRATPQPEVKPAPVSAMGQVLYGEGADVSLPPARAVQPVQPRTDTVTPRQPLPERTIPVQAQVRPQPVASNTTPPVSIETARSPEDILDAARSRVLAANQSVTAERPLPQAPAVAGIAATQAQPVPSLAGAQAQPDAKAQKDATALEFERILDAQITGDLGKLSADPVRIDGEKRASAPLANPAGRQEPRLGAVQGNRTEPSLEDEMNRMLNEIAENRKN
ncbi:flagellar biosynthetic protein FliO [Pararhizobium sp. DWP3-4]|uniref:flagellar biosynthetic protein FliO n=1 Tax=Pararhizobium sp. DWP3-4 TaxID=2804565 RepID=UPI003CEB156B